ncbi:AfsR/SARP family transcriptional regulator [Streptomyces sp. SID3212]|uniref:AfsR/SARP family transcriptional regulator n=1 Tax=unclassified Streptomyces TaxID=2593676 RepID=UPI001926AD1E|nr:AfsR/SARP family transcriptional regulator [Streptomyces sp. SID3212]
MGSFEIITDGGQVFAPKAPKLCQILAVLALQPTQAVATDTLIRELWGESSPAGTLKTLQTHIYHARKMLADACASLPKRELLVTQAPGYRLLVSEEEIDLCLFERLVRRAQAELAQGAPALASQSLDQAMTLWRGPLLSNVPTGDVLAGQLAHAEELKIRALELRVETEHRRGHYRDFLPELRKLVNDYPLHEWFHEQLIRSLHRAGRRAEALDAYQDLHYVLRRELDLEPSKEIQRLRVDMLGASAKDASVLQHGGGARTRTVHRPFRASSSAI